MDDRAATLTQTQGKSTSEAAVLQQKMKKAAKIVTEEWIVKPTLLYEDFGSFIFCTPENVFFRLDGEWIRITREYVEEAVIESNFYNRGKTRWIPSSAANFVLSSIREYCEFAKRVSWTLPRIKRQKWGAL